MAENRRTHEPVVNPGEQVISCVICDVAQSRSVKGELSSSITCRASLWDQSNGVGSPFSRDGRLQRAMKFGVKIAAGSDMGERDPGKTRGQASVLMLEALRDEGMPPADVIRTATVNAAKILGSQDRVGSVEIDMFADVIAVGGDPLSNVAQLERVTFVMKDGHIMAR